MSVDTTQLWPRETAGRRRRAISSWGEGMFSLTVASTARDRSTVEGGRKRGSNVHLTRFYLRNLVKYDIWARRTIGDSGKENTNHVCRPDSFVQISRNVGMRDLGHLCCRASEGARRAGWCTRDSPWKVPRSVYSDSIRLSRDIRVRYARSGVYETLRTVDAIWNARGTDSERGACMWGRSLENRVSLNLT